MLSGLWSGASTGVDFAYACIFAKLFARMIVTKVGHDQICSSSQVCMQPLVHA